MKKRTIRIILAAICLLLLIAFELYLKTKHVGGEPVTPLGALSQQAAPWLIIAVIGVAAHDIINIRSRKETRPDYVMIKGFRVQEKKCTMGDECMVLLCLANCEKNAYDVTVTVTYLNVAGRVLGKETQTATGFVRGMEKHLFFRPGRDFHAFSYTLETTLFRGVSAESEFRTDGFRVVPLYSNEEGTPEPRKGFHPVQLHVTEEYVGTREVEVACTYLLLDKGNTVHGVYTPPPQRFTEAFPARTLPAAAFEYLSKGEIPIDEELSKEGVAGICVYTVTPM